MRRVKATLVFYIVLILAMAGFNAGCTDSVVSHDDIDGFEQRTDGDKFRHAHLLERALKTNDGLGKSADNGNHLGLIIGVRRGLDKQRLATRYRVATRFRLAHRYKIVQRFDYDHAMYGFAWTIEDSLGGDFQQLFDSLAADPDIEFFEPDIPMRQGPKDRPGSNNTSGQRVPPSIDRVGGHGHSASGVDVFVLDTGVSNDDVNVVEEVDFTDSPSGTSDIDGHGTHIAGTIAAIDDNDGVVGVAPGARIHSLKVLPDVDPNPDDREVDLSTAIAAVEHATGQKLANPNVPMVVNISLGADIGTTEYNALDEAIEASSAAGVVYVVAAGNEGIDASTVTPAHAASAITVGAYDPETDQFGAFSNYGPVVDILAPGVAVESLDKDNGPDEVQMSGTSMATGHVTGAVALFLADNPQASAVQVVAALDASGDAVIAGVPASTTDKTVRVAELLQMQVPPFFQYAVTCGNNLVLDKTITFSVEDGTLVNANIFANNDITIKTPQVLVRGFAYHGNNFKDNYGAFEPAYNPTNLPVHHEVEEIFVPKFDPEDHPGVATQVSGDLQLAGHYDLGTREQPVIWHVQGDLTTTGDVSFSGFGVFMVDNTIEIKHNVTLEASEDAIGLYANNNFSVKESDLTIMGMLLSGNNMVLTGNTTLYGSIVVENNLTFKGQTTLYYRPAPPTLTEPFWPMNSQP